MLSKARFLAHLLSATAVGSIRHASVLIVILSMVAPPFSLHVLAQEIAQNSAAEGASGQKAAQHAAPGKAAKSENDVLVEGLLSARAEAAAKVSSIPRAREFLKSTDARVKAHGGRISLRNLDLTKPPGEAELRQSGQLGSPLSPSGDADPEKIPDAAKKRKQQDDNLLFGQAMQKWNEHAYADAVKIFRQHRGKFQKSPWSGEAELHLGCNAQFSGSWAEAKFSFEWILNNHKKGEAIYQKAKLRRAVLHIDQGELLQAGQTFEELLKTETDWERRTYAAHWLQQLSLYKGHEVALRDCGAESVAYVLSVQGQNEKAAEVKATLAPDPRGFSLGELMDFADNAGLDAANAVRMGFEDLDTVPYPFIAHYSDRHFVAVQRPDENGGLWVYDPRLKRETLLSREQFSEQWSGLGVIFGGLPEGGRLASLEEMSENYGGCCGLPRNENDLGKCKGKKPAAKNSCSTSSCQMPTWEVNPVNMNLVVEDTPMWYEAAAGPDVFLTITYNSQDALNQMRPFGNKWTFDYASYALESPAQGGSGTVLIVMPGGRRDNYQPNGSGGYTSPVGVFNQLVKTGPYAFDLTLLDGSVYRYGVPAGVSGTTSLLLSITDHHGIPLTMTYDASGNLTKIADSQNREWVFSYNGQGLVSSIDDPFGRQVTFSYDGANNLVGQIDMGGLVYGYTYDANVYLASIVKPSGTTHFLVEPADGVNNGSVIYPPPGGTMWENYRITVTDPIGNKEEFYYEGYHRFGWHRDKEQMLSAAVDLNGTPKTRYDYAVIANQGVVSRVTFADGNYQEFSNFNANRLPQTVRNERGKLHYFTYNSKGRILTHTDPRSNVTAREYAANGIDLVKIKDAATNTVLELTYDAHRNVISAKDALNRTTSITYNAVDQPETITDATNTVWTLEYDGANLLTTVKQGGDTLQSLTYDAYDRVATKTNADGYALGYTYDSLNRPVRVTFPDGTFTENQWGCCTIERQSDRAGRVTTFLYDSLNRLIAVRDPLGQLTLRQYDAEGKLTKSFDANLNATQWRYDKRNRVAEKIYANGISESFGYDAVGNRTTTVDALGVTTTYVFDDANNMTSRSATGLATVSFTYDAMNRPSQMIDGLGTTLFGYNLAGELTSVDGPWADDVITLGYDALGRVDSRDVNGATASMVFDDFGRVTSVSNPLGMFTYGYSGAVSSELTSLSYPNGQTTSLSYFGNVGDRRLQTLWHKTAAAQTISKMDYEYDTVGEITKWTRQVDASGAQAYEFGYDAVSQLTDAVLKTVVGGTVQTSYSYIYDPAGNRSGEAIDTLVSEDSHNNLNQLTVRQAGAGVLPIRGNVDEPVASVTVNGNAATVRGQQFEGGVAVASGNNMVTVVATDLSGNSKTRQYQVAVTGSGTRTLSYDDKGNLLNDGVKTYEWDVLNRLVAINYTGTSPTERTEFAYNGLNQRVKVVEKSGGSAVSEKRFIWIPGDVQPIEERDGNNTVARRFYLQGEQIAGASYYYTRDHLGCLRELTDSTGTLRARYDFDPFGRRRTNSVVVNPVEASFGFTGHYWHEKSGLALAAYRSYDADLGRWLSRDPIGEMDGNNLYAYVGNDPILYTDPFGLARWPDYVQGSVSIPLAITGGLAGPQFSLAIDKYGHGYVSGGGGFGWPFNAGAMGTMNWLCKNGEPSPAELEDFLTGLSITLSGAYYIAAQATANPKNNVSAGVGAGAKGLGAGVSWGIKLW